MAKVLVTDTHLEDIADAIRTKLGVATTYRPGDMAAAIESISGGGYPEPTGTIEITANGTVNVKDYASANVNVPRGGAALIEEWDLTRATDPLIGTLNNMPLINRNVSITASGAVFTGGDQALRFDGWPGCTFEVDVAEMNLQSGTEARFLMTREGTYGLVYRSDGEWALLCIADTEYSGETDGSFFDGSTIRVHIDTESYWHIYKDGVLWWEPELRTDISQYPRFYIGNTTNSINNTTISGVRMLGNSGGSAVSENDILFHFNDDYKNAGRCPCVWINRTGLELSAEQSKFGGGSLKTGNTQTDNNVNLGMDFALGTEDFTLDFWCYPTNLPTSGSVVPVAFNYRSLAIYMNQSAIQFGISNASGSSWFDIVANSISISNNEWHHVAVVRDGVEIYCFLDGVKLHTVQFGDGNYAAISNLTLGSNTYSSGDRRFAGYIDEFRLLIGEAVWTDDFTPPTEPYA